MTKLQWLLEFESLQEKDTHTVKQIDSIIKVFKIMMIRLLGLDVMKDKLADIDKDIEKQFDSFIPLSLLAGRREIVETVMKRMNEDEAATKAINDQNFEKMSAAIAAGDMEPILDGAPVISAEQQLLNQQEELKRIGVLLVDKPIVASHISSAKSPEIKKVKIEFDRE